MSYLWTSEAVSKGHPDKVADQIADAVLDAYLELNPLNRVACEVTCCKNLILVTGEVSESRRLDIDPIVKRTLTHIGYDRPEHSFNVHDTLILNAINSQSLEIAKAVAKDSGEIGAGDQGLMFGYACDETPSFMPLAHHLSFELVQALESEIKRHRSGDHWESLLLPDAKTQVTLSLDDDGRPEFIHTVLISTQHRSDAPIAEVRALTQSLATAVLEKSPYFDAKRVHWLLNPAGAWSKGGPAADTGLSGRKIVVDNYGADCPIGGGSFSGKDPTKVDRSAAYAARHIAKNIVAAKLAKRCQVQVAYAIGVTDPISMRVQTFGTSPLFDRQLTEMVQAYVPLSPQAIIDRLDLRRPIYSATAAGGHFGRPELPWEQLDLAETFLNSRLLD